MVCMKANPDKFQFIILGNKDSHTLQFGDITTKPVSSVTLLGITIDSKLNFKETYQYFFFKKNIINYMPPRGTTKETKKKPKS